MKLNLWRYNPPPACQHCKRASEEWTADVRPFATLDVPAELLPTVGTFVQLGSARYFVHGIRVYEAIDETQVQEHNAYVVRIPEGSYVDPNDKRPVFVLQPAHVLQLAQGATQ